VRVAGGAQEIIRGSWHGNSYAGLAIEVIHASEQITMHDKAAAGGAREAGSSMRVGLRLVARGAAVGFVTAGNTARHGDRQMCWGRSRVDRPALAAGISECVGTWSIKLDVSPNVDCKPENLEQSRDGRDLLS